MELGFPAWFFHKEHGEKLVHSSAEFEALGEGWFDSPAKVVGVDVKKPEADKHEDLALLEKETSQVEDDGEKGSEVEPKRRGRKPKKVEG